MLHINPTILENLFNTVKAEREALIREDGPAYHIRNLTDAQVMLTEQLREVGMPDYIEALARQ